VKVTTRGRYAVMALVSLASDPGARPVPLKEVARREAIPEAYLQQLFVRLRRQGIVRSVRGPGGGFVLGRPPSAIPVGEVIRTAEARRGSVGCRDANPGCGRLGSCRTQGMWDTVERKVEEFLDSVTVQDLFEGNRSCCDREET
jgi:Rrf2 family iron-sulfur cluster assembly transcriptional regulator